jgi:hypothetical protein
MLAIVWIALFVIAASETALLLTGRLPDVIAPLLGMGLGLTLAFGALDLEVASGGSVTSVPSQGLAALGLAVLILNAVFIFSSAIESIPTGLLGGR